MGKKKRIMTSGQKFVDKYRHFLKKAGDQVLRDGDNDGAVDDLGDSSVIDVPGQKPFIDNLEVTAIENQTFSFIAALGGVPAASDTVTVTLNGAVLTTAPALPDAIETENHTIGGVAYTKAYFARPASAVPADTNWEAADRRCLDAADTPVVAPVGENTLKVAVTQNNKVRASQTVKFTVAAADGAMTQNAALVADAGGQQISVNITGRVSGKLAGDHDAWDISKNGYEIEVTKDGEAVVLSADGANRTRKANAAGVANTVAVVPKGGAGQLTQANILNAAGNATDTFVVTFHLLNTNLKNY